MDKAATNSIIRFFLLWFLQVFILKQVIWGWDGVIYLQIFLYPLFILLLPLNTPRGLTILLAFVLGLAIDWLYESPGLHALHQSICFAYPHPPGRIQHQRPPHQEITWANLVFSICSHADFHSFIRLLFFGSIYFCIFQIYPAKGFV